MKRQFSIPDGLIEIRKELPLIIAMIEQSARWVHPDTFHALPIWCPDTARGRPRYNADWSKVLVSEKGVPKVEENVRAAKAFMAALGLRGKKPSNWTVCHIWGYDDDKFAAQSNIVKDPRYYSCIGNMIWLPTPLKGFTDAVPEIKKILRICAFHMYGWICEHPDAATEAEKVRNGPVPDEYPKLWPTPERKVLPPGTAPFSSDAAAAVKKRKCELKRMLSDTSLVHFPREEARSVLAFWKIDL